MGEMRTLPARDALRFCEPGPVALLTTMHRDQPNVMAAAWLRAVSLEPVMIGVSVHPSRLSHFFMSATEQFGLSFVTIDLISAVHLAGAKSGRDVDKWQESGLTPQPALEIEAPLVQEGIAHIECAVTDRVTIGDHDLFVARVLNVRADSESFSGTWQPAEEGGQLLHHLGGDRYAVLGKTYHATTEGDSQSG